MTRTGKIARLPHNIREHLNQRLQNGAKASSLLPWLNGLPEVQAMLKSHFSAKPINAVNLTEWKNGGYHDWFVRQQALELVHSLDDDPCLDDKSEPFAAKLSRWAAVHLAATAQSLVANEVDPETKWSRLREFVGVIYRLRRGDSDFERLAIDRDWLSLEKSNTALQREEEFWRWTQRPEIREKLYPGEIPGLSLKTIEKIERELNLM